MVWHGQAPPGPVSPRSWMEGIYNYAVKGIKSEKLFLGLPAYGWNWRIHDTPANMGMVNRGVSNTYYAARLWMQGGYNFTNDAPPQPMIPFISYWDDYDKVPWTMPHVYDYFDGSHASAKAGPITQDIYNRHRYLTCYGKQQQTDFGTIHIDRNGVPDSTTGRVGPAGAGEAQGYSGAAPWPGL